MKHVKLADQMAGHVSSAQALIEKGRADGLSDEEQVELDRHVAEAKAAKAQLESFVASDRVLADIAAHTAEVQERSEQESRRSKASTLAEHVLADPAFKAWRESLPTTDNVPVGNSPAVAIPVGLKALFKAPLTGGSDTSAGAMVFPDVQSLVELPQRPLTVRSFITVGQTDSDTVTFPRVASTTNAATPTAELSAAGESAMTLEVVTEYVRDIPHYFEASKRALADAGQLRTLLEQFLLYGLEEELEDQIVQGGGTGQNLAGILETSGTQTQAWDTDIFTTIRKAITKARVTGRARQIVVAVHPTEAETIDLQRDSYDRFYGAGPFGAGPNTLWGYPRIETEALPQGTALVGDLRQAVLWDRQQASISVSDSHDVNFTKQIVTILANLRVAFGVLRPAAIVETDVDLTVS